MGGPENSYWQRVQGYQAGRVKDAACLQGNGIDLRLSIARWGVVIYQPFGALILVDPAGMFAQVGMLQLRKLERPMGSWVLTGL